MFKKGKSIIKDSYNLENYIEQNDIFNSELILKLLDPDLPKVGYKIKTYEYRPDLISKDFYGSEMYEGLLLLQVGEDLSFYKKGVTLNLLDKDIIDNIISSLR